MYIIYILRDYEILCHKIRVIIQENVTSFKAVQRARLAATPRPARYTTKTAASRRSNAATEPDNAPTAKMKKFAAS